MSKLNQKQRVLLHIRTYGHITSLDGLKMDPPVVHIPGVIRDLRKDGVPVVGRDCISKNGKHYKRYYAETGRSIKCPKCQARMDDGLVDWHDYKHTEWTCPVCQERIRAEEWLTEGELDDIFRSHGGEDPVYFGEDYEERRAAYEMANARF